MESSLGSMGEQQQQPEQQQKQEQEPEQQQGQQPEHGEQGHHPLQQRHQQPQHQPQLPHQQQQQQQPKQQQPHQDQQQQPHQQHQQHQQEQQPHQDQQQEQQQPGEEHQQQQSHQDQQQPQQQPQQQQQEQQQRPGEEEPHGQPGSPSVTSPAVGQAQPQQHEQNQRQPGPPLHTSRPRSRYHLTDLSQLRPHSCPSQASTSFRSTPAKQWGVPPTRGGLDNRTATARSACRHSHSTSPSSTPAQKLDIPGYIATPGQQYSQPPAIIMRSHGGVVEGQLVYQFGKVAPLAPAYSPAWVRDPPQRSAVADYRLQPSQRSVTCYSPEFILQTAAPGGWASPPRPSTATSQPSTRPHTTMPLPRKSPGGSAAAPTGFPRAVPRPGTAPACAQRAGELRPCSMAGGWHAFGKHAPSAQHGGRIQFEQRPKGTSPPAQASYTEGIRRGLPRCPHTDFIRATARSSFQSNEKRQLHSGLRQAMKEVLLAQIRSRQAQEDRDDRLQSLVPTEVIQHQNLASSSCDSPRLRYTQQQEMLKHLL